MSSIEETSARARVTAQIRHRVVPETDGPVVKAADRWLKRLSPHFGNDGAKLGVTLVG